MSQRTYAQTNADLKALEALVGKHARRCVRAYGRQLGVSKNTKRDTLLAMLISMAILDAMSERDQQERKP